MPQSIPAGLTQEYVLRTADLDAGIDHPFGPPTGYELVHEGKRYAPKAVRLHVESLAHVYEEGDDSGTSRILVIGGAALASLDRNALSGVIAHELGHFAGRDTALSHRAFRWHRMMLHVELALIEMPWNPLGWMLRGYHL